MIRGFGLILVSLAFIGCASTSTIKPSDYSTSQTALKSGDIFSAYSSVPQKERDGFVTTLEKNWLGLWLGKSHPAELVNQSKTFDQRKYIQVSKELSYFYEEAPDGYIPSEHEVIVHHLVTSMAFIQKNEIESAKVEARKAAYYLQGEYNPNVPHFDDPFLRVWLASIWISLDEWQSAQVDLRRAGELGGKPLAWCKDLADQPRQPQEFAIVFSGAGPKIEWEELTNVPKITVEPKATPLDHHETANRWISAAPWYERHSARNHDLRDFLMKSKYMSQLLAVKSLSTTERVAGLTVDGAMKLTGLVAGAVIIGGGIYLVLSANVGGEAAGQLIGIFIIAGTTVGKKLLDMGDNVRQTITKDADRFDQKHLDSMRTYRLVRFLPTSMHAMPANYGTLNLSRPQIEFTSPLKKSKVQFFYFPKN